MRRRDSVIIDETGNCAKLDAACAERVSRTMGRCSEQYIENQRQARESCRESFDPQRCKEVTEAYFQDKILDCFENN